MTDRTRGSGVPGKEAGSGRGVHSRRPSRPAHRLCRIISFPLASHGEREHRDDAGGAAAHGIAPAHGVALHLVTSEPRASAHPAEDAAGERAFPLPWGLSDEPAPA